MDTALAPPILTDLVAQRVDGGIVLRHDGSAPEVMRERIASLTANMLAHPELHRQLEVEEVVGHGMYLRKLYIPPFTLLAGRVHLKGCMNIVAKGRLAVLTEFGCELLTEGWTGVSPPGIQKMGQTDAEGAVFINVFRTDLTDPRAIEAEVAAAADIKEIAP